MKNIFKPFVEWGINLRSNAFLKARLKLALFYTVILFLVVTVFSFLLYLLFVNNIINSLEFEGVGGFEGESNIEYVVLREVINRLQIVLITIDIAIILVIGGLSYFLAGKTLRPIKKALEDQKRFVSDSAHELRTPLSIMKTGIEAVTLDKKQSIEDYKYLSKDLLEEINKLTYMSNDLLFLAQSDSGKLKKQFNNINMSMICTNQFKLMKTYADKKGINFKEEIEESCYIKGNKDQLNRLITNLLKNAIDYNVKGGKVLLNLKKLNYNIVLIVSDTGVGIAPEDIRHIFERFYKADKSRSTSDSGSGLGLSIAKEIVESHNGIIKVDSKKGKGTIIEVLFHSL
ncbi:MAG: hypothetical protein COT09_04540 [Candidatus Hydromicrobium americanum]|nr:MAG: hypothetical protein COT09_04540 [Candidatus Hydromicrobium americanum]